MERDNQESNHSKRKQKNDALWLAFLNEVEKLHKNKNIGESAPEKPNTTFEWSPLLNTKVLSHPNRLNHELSNLQLQSKDTNTSNSAQKIKSITSDDDIKLSQIYKNVMRRSEAKNKLHTSNEDKLQVQSHQMLHFLSEHKYKKYSYENKAKQNSIIRDTDIENPVENQSTLSNYSNYSITKSTNYQGEDVNLSSNNLVTVCDYNLPEISGDLNKLQMMTSRDLKRDSYARFVKHESEMKDYVRTISYRNCIKYCSEKYIKNKVVLIVRSGIGLLPMLCVRDGLAKIVIALEQSACIEYARRIVKDNSYSHNITFIQSSVFDLKNLPYGLREVDVIMSDFIGDCVLSRSDLMEQVIEARNRFLKPNGLMVPMRVDLYCQLLEQRSAYENQHKLKYKNKKNNNITSKTKLDQFEVEAYDSDSSSDSTRNSWWSDVYGFDMRSKPNIIVDNNSEDEEPDKVEWCIMDAPLFSYFDPRKVVSTPCLMKEFDMYNCTIADVRLVQCKDLRFKCITPFTSAHGGDYAHMLEMFVVVDFPNGYDVTPDVTDNTGNLQIGFSTSSFSPKTQYRQTGLMLRDQLLVNKGDEFIINEFHMWRGQQNQVNNPFENVSVNRNSCNSSQEEEYIKMRLRYTFMNKYVKAINRRCAYTITRHLS